MRAREDREPSLFLEMSVTEGRLLMGIMQNPLFGETPETEEEEVRQLRHNIFHTLKEFMDRRGY